MTDRDEMIARAVFQIARAPSMATLSVDDVIALLPSLGGAIDTLIAQANHEVEWANGLLQ